MIFFLRRARRLRSNNPSKGRSPEYARAYGKAEPFLTTVGGAVPRKAC